MCGGRSSTGDLPFWLSAEPAEGGAIAESHSDITTIIILYHITSLPLSSRFYEGCLSAFSAQNNFSANADIPYFYPRFSVQPLHW
jgi:hypothetical protein